MFVHKRPYRAIYVFLSRGINSGKPDSLPSVDSIGNAVEIVTIGRKTWQIAAICQICQSFLLYGSLLTQVAQVYQLQ